MELVTVKINNEALKKLKKIAAETGEFIYQVIDRLAVFELTRMEQDAKDQAKRDRDGQGK